MFVQQLPKQPTLLKMGDRFVYDSYQGKCIGIVTDDVGNCNIMAEDGLVLCITLERLASKLIDVIEIKTFKERENI